MGIGATPEERQANFLEGLSYQKFEDPEVVFPTEGTTVKACFFSDDPYFTTLLVKASPVWSASARKCGSFLSEIGQLRFFPRSKKDGLKKVCLPA